MGLLVVLGEAARVEGFALGGATVIAAEDPDDVRAAWTRMAADDVAVVVLTSRAAAALGGAGPSDGVLSVVMPP